MGLEAQREQDPRVRLWDLTPLGPSTDTPGSDTLILISGESGAPILFSQS